MSFRFSQKLIDETIKCFKEEDGVELSPEITEQYLESFAKFYIAFARKKLVEQFSVDALATQKRLDSSSDLISPHNCNDK
ncbi:MAG: hypothetical protein PHN69_02695 [Candidatus Pacebacteria bacterium]|nr:hypothetical protein [Candidatus Paceibacterota bacterium]